MRRCKPWRLTAAESGSYPMAGPEVTSNLERVPVQHLDPPGPAAAKALSPIQQALGHPVIMVEYCRR